MLGGGFFVAYIPGLFSAHFHSFAVFFFKRLIRDYLAEEEFLFDEESRMQVLRLETRIDNLVLLAFGLYMNCREALFSVKLNDMQRRNSQLLRFVQRFNVPQGPGEDQEEVTGS